MTEAPFAPSLLERVDILLNRVDYRLAETEAERDAIFRLRYDAYLREGAIAADTIARVQDRFDDSPNGRLIGVYLDGTLAASIRIHLVDSENADSPALDAFPAELRPVARSHMFIDPNRFVADHAVSRFCPELPYIVLRLPFIAAGHWGAGFVTATVRSEHSAFYRRVLRCSKVAGPRPYPTLLKPLGLLLVSYPREAPKVLQSYPFFEARPNEADQIFGDVTAHEAPNAGNPHVQRILAAENDWVRRNATYSNAKEVRP